MLMTHEKDEGPKTFIPCDQEALFPVSIAEQILVRCSG
jgi:hypothetical protein